jgi:hypothetical protein
MPHSLVAPGKQGPADIYLYAKALTPRIRNHSGWKHKLLVIGNTLFQSSRVLVFEFLTPEQQMETLRASRGSSASDNLQVVLVLTWTWH